jgi:hypothetical protein
MWKKSLATLGLLTLLNIPVFSQYTSKTDSLLRNYFLDKKTERSVLIGDNNLIDVTLFSSPRFVKTNVFAHKKAVDKYDTLTHVHNHIEDVHLQGMWMSKKNKRKFKRAFKRFDEKTLENRLLTRISTSVDIVNLIFLEKYALENNKKFNYEFIVTNGKDADIYEFGLNENIVRHLKKLSKEKRFEYGNEIYHKYDNLIREYISGHCKLWETGDCKEPSNEELTDLINEQGIVFIREKEN